MAPTASLPIFREKTMPGKDFYANIRTKGGISLAYEDLIETDFAAVAGAPYSPPEEGIYRRIDVTRAIQLLSDSPVVIETFQTSAGEVRLPANTASESTDDAGDGRLFFFKNSGVGSVTIKDYTATTTVFVLPPGICLFIVGNALNNWDLAFIGKNLFFDPTGTDLTAGNVEDAIKQLYNSATVSASPGFTWGRSGTLPPGTYLLNDSVSSNTTGRVVPIQSGYIKEIFVAVDAAGTYTFSIEKRVGVTFTELVAVTITGVRTDSFTVNVPVTYKDELCCLVKSTSAGSPKNPVVGLVIKGSL